ncbi:hypothetical protein PQX77_007792 [Marasmius sp. AFHP31]|nr:hypothetical protein PQX77_011785 [Marasmius sp. AFHP31]KAK1229220.1 hypothetical protein PQX77_007792 [Marasmius sp. AFHP31]
MADSLSPECTPLKKEYDSCFNSWFEGYLEPAVSISSQAPQQQQRAREEYSRKKADEFQQKCGKLWDAYKGCVQKALKEKGLDKILEQAREENSFKEMPPIVQDKSK